MKPAHSHRWSPGFWCLVCAFCAALGYGVGRLTKPSVRSAPSAVLGVGASAARSGAILAGHERIATGATTLDNLVIASAAAPADARRRALIELLQRINRGGRQENFGDMFRLVTWTQVASEDELAEALALGAALEPVSGSPIRDLVPMFVFSRWAAIDGPAALAAHMELPSEQRSDQALDVLFKAWVNEGDPQDALDHALACRRAAEESGMSENVLREILQSWDQRDSAAALAAARQLATSADPKERLAGVQLAAKAALRMAEDLDTASALDWIDQWPDGAARDQLRLNLLAKTGDTSADATTIGSVIARMESTAGVAQNKSLRNQAQRLAHADLDAARRWASALPAPARAAVAAVIANRLNEKGDWRAAAEWVGAQITDPSARAESLGQAADTAAQQGELTDALALARRASDDGQPAGAERQAELLASWLRADPARAAMLLPHALATEGK